MPGLAKTTPHTGTTAVITGDALLRLPGRPERVRLLIPVAPRRPRRVATCGTCDGHADARRTALAGHPGRRVSGAAPIG